MRAAFGAAAFWLGGTNLLHGQATLYWDRNGNSDGAGSTPTGTWSASASNWNTSFWGTNSTTSFTSGSNAVFSAGFDATNTYTVTVSGNQSVSSLTVTMGSPTFTGGTITFNDSSPDLWIISGATATINSVIAGSNGIDKTGSGTLILGGTAKTYTGTTIVDGGVLQLDASNLISNNSALSIGQDGTFRLNWGISETVASLAGSGTLDLRTGTLTVGNASDTTFTGSIQDSYGSLVKQGTGSLTLSGTSTFTGAVTVNAGNLVVASNTALGDSTWGNTVANGAAVQFQGGVTVTEGSFSVTGSGASSTGALANLSGDNTLNASVNLDGNTTIGSAAGSLNLTGQVALGSGNTLTATGAGNLTLSGAITDAGNLTKTGSGTLTLSGSAQNSFSGAFNINDGTVVLAKSAGTRATGGGTLTIGDGTGAAGSAVVRLGASNQIADYLPLITVNADGQLSLNNFSESIDSVAGTGTIDTGSSGYLGIGINSGSSTFSGLLAGAGTIEKLGSGTLTLTASQTFYGTLLLSGGTLQLSNADLVLGTLTITADSTIDFSGIDSSLSVTTFSLINGAKLTITGWTDAVDFFTAVNWSGATHDATGSAPMNQVTFTSYSANQTNWDSYDNQLRPRVPEPSTYGAVLIASLLSVLGIRPRFICKTNPADRNATATQRAQHSRHRGLMKFQANR